MKTSFRYPLLLFFALASLCCLAAAQVDGSGLGSNGPSFGQTSQSEYSTSGSTVQLPSPDQTGVRSRPTRGRPRTAAGKRPELLQTSTTPPSDIPTDQSAAQPSPEDPHSEPSKRPKQRKLGAERRERLGAHQHAESAVALSRTPRHGNGPGMGLRGMPRHASPSLLSKNELDAFANDKSIGSRQSRTRATGPRRSLFGAPPQHRNSRFEMDGHDAGSSVPAHPSVKLEYDAIHIPGPDPFPYSSVRPHSGLGPNLNQVRDGHGLAAAIDSTPIGSGLSHRRGLQDFDLNATPPGSPSQHEESEGVLHAVKEEQEVFGKIGSAIFRGR